MVNPSRVSVGPPDGPLSARTLAPTLPHQPATATTRRTRAARSDTQELRRDELDPEAVRVLEVRRVGARPVLRPRPGLPDVAAPVLEARAVCRHHRRLARRAQRDVPVAGPGLVAARDDPQARLDGPVGDRRLGRMQASVAE